MAGSFASLPAALSRSLDTANRTFVLTDKSTELKVNYTGAPPADFTEGNDVVVKGTLRPAGGLVLVAKEMVVGCASKYWAFPARAATMGL